MSGPYPLERIAKFIATERMAIHGTSPETHTQNKRLIKALQGIAPKQGDNLLGLQVIGSRTNGTANTESDIDLAQITFGQKARARAIHGAGRIHQVAQGLHLDRWMAAEWVRIPTFVPSDPDDFIFWIRNDARNIVGMFEEGLYVSPLMHQVRAAAAQVIRSSTTPSQVNDIWQKIRHHHASLYTGNLPRAQRKLTERVALDEQGRVVDIINEDVWQQRYSLLALPELFSDQEEAISLAAVDNAHLDKDGVGQQFIDDVTIRLVSTA